MQQMGTRPTAFSTKTTLFAGSVQKKHAVPKQPRTARGPKESPIAIAIKIATSKGRPEAQLAEARTGTEPKHRRQNQLIGSCIDGFEAMQFNSPAASVRASPITDPLAVPQAGPATAPINKANKRTHGHADVEAKTAKRVFRPLRPSVPPSVADSRGGARPSVTPWASMVPMGLPIIMGAGAGTSGPASSQPSRRRLFSTGVADTLSFAVPPPAAATASELSTVHPHDLSTHMTFKPVLLGPVSQRVFKRYKRSSPPAAPLLEPLAKPDDEAVNKAASPAYGLADISPAYWSSLTGYGLPQRPQQLGSLGAGPQGIRMVVEVEGTCTGAGVGTGLVTAPSGICMGVVSQADAFVMGNEANLGQQCQPGQRGNRGNRRTAVGGIMGATSQSDTVVKGGEGAFGASWGRQGRRGQRGSRGMALGAILPLMGSMSLSGSSSHSNAPQPVLHALGCDTEDEHRAHCSLTVKSCDDDESVDLPEMDLLSMGGTPCAMCPEGGMDWS